MDAGTSSDPHSSSSMSLPVGEFQVFLSFRGPDTRKGFTDYLYSDLHAVGVRTFRDDNELRIGGEIGPELLKAIEESSISIPIFSKNYAASKWCLMELAKMVECRRKRGQLILPIFYDVKPSEVKDQSGCYEESFRDNQWKGESFDESTVNQWKEALREVGDLNGWEVEKEADGHQGKLIKEMIVPTVFKELKNNYMVEADNLVGIDYHGKEMMKLLRVVSNDKLIVGIHGMGGIGKTTIAKFIYNKLLKSFDCSSFLEDVRETVKQHKGIVSLQNILLTDTPRYRYDIAHVDRGINMIKCSFSKKKVLIVLDDVDEKSQFDWLVGNCDYFGPGSRIILTTRDKHVLNVLNIHATYEPPFMNSEQSLQLFHMNAFKSKFPSKDFDNISRKVARTAAGLPLALEALSSFLSDKELSEWEETLKQSKETPRDEVTRKLRISYDALNYDQQQIFLDIACLFFKMDKTIVFYMWDACEYHPKLYFSGLYLRSLVKVGDANELWMHKQHRALGKKIVVDEKIQGEISSRLWNHEKALDILDGRRGTKNIKALTLDFKLGPDRKPRFTGNDFSELKNLMYLQVDGADLVGDFERSLSNLRWFNWRGCPPDIQATNFHMRNLVILDLSNSHITEDWGGWNQIQMASKLKVLRLANCALRRTPDLSSYATLEILILRYCKSLVEIDPSIGHLKNLKVLDIANAEIISRLPDEIWMLEKLEVIDATSCSHLRGNIPGDLGKLSSLRFLSFCDTKIQSLPTSIWELTRLKTLDLGGCTELQSQPELPSCLKSLQVARIDTPANLINLQELHFVGALDQPVEIPKEIENLSKLEKLTLDLTKIKTLPEEIGSLSQLKVLDLRCCFNLQYILGLPSSLVDLSLAFCYELERLPVLSNLKNLSKLLLYNCTKLTAVQGLGVLESLTKLDIHLCNVLANLDLPENSQSLKILAISDCPTLDRIQGLDKLVSVTHLDLHGCNNLREINGIEGLESLKLLDVSGCSSLGEIPNLPNTHIRLLEDQTSDHNELVDGLWLQEYHEIFLNISYQY